jgi:hypothetical protein
MREREVWTVFAAFRNRRAAEHPVDTVVDILRDFGAVGAGDRPTPLGHWARHELEGRIPPVVTPELPAREFLAYLASLAEGDDIWDVTTRWLREGHEVAAARELLLAAQDATPAERIAAVDAVGIIDDVIGGEAILALWHQASQFPGVGPHARAALAELGEAPDQSLEDRAWLAVEFAADSLSNSGVEDAWYEIQGAVTTGTGTDASVADITAFAWGSGHPAAGELAEAFAAAYGETGLQVPVYQLKISVRHTDVWRRVLVAANATLGDLHRVIRAVLGWGTEHLHRFDLGGGLRFSDPFYGLEMCGDEDSVRLNRAFPEPKVKITYVYDLGDDWRHDIVLEKVVGGDVGRSHPVCVGGAGDNPLEDYNPEYPEEPVPFDRDAINRRLARIGPAAGAPVPDETYEKDE